MLGLREGAWKRKVRSLFLCIGIPAARIDRRTYSSIISHPFRPVAKRTAVQFAIALRLDRDGADALLRSAGFALSPAIPEDIVFAEAIAAGGGDLRAVSEKLYENGMKAIA